MACTNTHTQEWLRNDWDALFGIFSGAFWFFLLVFNINRQIFTSYLLQIFFSMRSFSLNLVTLDTFFPHLLQCNALPCLQNSSYLPSYPDRPPMCRRIRPFLPFMIASPLLSHLQSSVKLFHHLVGQKSQHICQWISALLFVRERTRYNWSQTCKDSKLIAKWIALLH